MDPMLNLVYGNQPQEDRRKKRAARARKRRERQRKAKAEATESDKNRSEERVTPAPSSDWVRPEQEVWPTGTGESEIRAETVPKAEDREGVGVEHAAGDQNAGGMLEETAELKRRNRHDTESADPEDIRRQIRRLKKPSDKRVYDWKRVVNKEETPMVEPIQKNRIQIMAQLYNRNALVPYIQHGKVQEVSFDWEMPPNMFRTLLVRIFGLKGLMWKLAKSSTAASEGFEWAEISTLQKSMNQGDEMRIQIIRTKKRRPNSPEATMRVIYERNNSRRARGEHQEEWIDPHARNCVAILCEDTRVTVKEKTPHEKGTSQSARDHEESVQAENRRRKEEAAALEAELERQRQVDLKVELEAREAGHERRA
jgi:hypothetical protein